MRASGTVVAGNGRRFIPRFPIAPAGKCVNPTISNISQSLTALLLKITDRAPNAGWMLSQSSNLSLPLSQWETNRTGPYDGNGNLTTNILNTTTNPIGYFILK